MTKRKPLRAWCGAIAASLMPLCAIAATPQVDGPSALDQDQSIQKLKQESLDVIQQAQAVEQDFLYPGYNRLSVYIGVRITAMILRDVSVSIDGARPVTYEYPRSESVELQLLGNSLHRLIVMNAPTGRHRIHAQFTAQYAEARSGDPPFTGSYDGTFDKTNEPLDLELSLQRQGYLTRPELKFFQWSAAQ
ncbi:MAG: hypothetical protein JOY51_04040 [Nevskia sp.]|nr:hypothetical protein [Nevskia sp.]